jgi:hypothetical protein
MEINDPAVRIYAVRFVRAAAEDLTYRVATRSGELMAVALASVAWLCDDPGAGLIRTEVVEEPSDEHAADGRVLGPPEASAGEGLPAVWRPSKRFTVRFATADAPPVVYRVVTPDPFNAVTIATTALARDLETDQLSTVEIVETETDFSFSWDDLTDFHASEA